MQKIKLLLLSLLLTSSAIAQENKDEADAIQLPAITQNYASFYSSAQLDFAIDLDSLTALTDKSSDQEVEMRYVLKATSKQGAINISYEGIRCDTREKIIYALLTDDGKWKKVRAPRWSVIPKSGINLQHLYLADDYFCSEKSLSGSVETIRDRIKWNRPLKN